MQQNLSSILWRRKKLFLLAALGAGGYLYYRSDSFQRRKNQVILLIRAISKLLDSTLAISDSAAILSGDLHAFLTSDDPRPPRSLRQIFKLLQCPELQDLLAITSTRLSREIFIGSTPTPPPSRSRSKNIEIFSPTRRKSDHPALPERLLTKLFSEPGKGFASAVAGSAVRSLVLTIIEKRSSGSSDEEEESGDSVFELGPSGVVRSSSSRSRRSNELGENLLSLASSSRGKALIGDCIQQFVEALVSTYLEKTKDVNIFEEALEAVTMPEHEQQAKEMIVSVCNGAVDTLVRTSYQVLASDDSSRGSGGSGMKNSGSIRDVAENVFQVAAVPGNRELIMELAGRVSSEAVRSFVQVLHREIAGVKERVIGEAGVKALILLTLCMSVFLHMVTKSWLS